MTLPDFPSVSPIPELESLESSGLEPTPIRTHGSEGGRRRVFIPNMPVTPVSERRCAAIPIKSYPLCSTLLGIAF